MAAGHAAIALDGGRPIRGNDLFFFECRGQRFKLPLSLALLSSTRLFVWIHHNEVMRTMYGLFDSQLMSHLAGGDQFYIARGNTFADLHPMS